MKDDLTSTIRLVRRPRVTTDAVGGTVWADSIETLELEMVSTSMLEVMLGDDTEGTRRKMEQLAPSGDGALARLAGCDSFEVVSNDELQEALSDDDTHDGGALELVTTQMLRVMIDNPDKSINEVSEELQLIEEANAAGGFDPYNNC